MGFVRLEDDCCFEEEALGEDEVAVVAFDFLVFLGGGDTSASSSE